MNEQVNGIKRGQVTTLASSGKGKSRLCNLLPTTMRAKQLIKEHGPVWIVKHGPIPMQCFGNEEGFGIDSLDGNHFRNVRSEHIERFTEDEE